MFSCQSALEDKFLATNFLHALVYHVNFQLKYFIQHIKKHQLSCLKYMNFKSGKSMKYNN